MSFKARLKAVRSVVLRMLCGQAFHCCGSATEYARSANTVLVRGTSIRIHAAALRLFRSGSDDKGVRLRGCSPDIGPTQQRACRHSLYSILIRSAASVASLSFQWCDREDQDRSLGALRWWRTRCSGASEDDVRQATAAFQLSSLDRTNASTSRCIVALLIIPEICRNLRRWWKYVEAVLETWSCIVSSQTPRSRTTDDGLMVTDWSWRLRSNTFNFFRFARDPNQISSVSLGFSWSCFSEHQT